MVARLSGAIKASVSSGEFHIEQIDDDNFLLKYNAAMWVRTVLTGHYIHLYNGSFHIWCDVLVLVLV